MAAVLDMMVVVPDGEPVRLNVLDTAAPALDLSVVVGHGIRGPAGVVVIAAGQTEPPMGTPSGVVVYRRLT